MSRSETYYSRNIGKLSLRQTLRAVNELIATDLLFTGAKAKVAGKVLTMSGSALQTSAIRGKQACDKLGIIGKEVAEITGIAIQNGVRATETVLDLVRHNPELATAEGGVAKFVKETFEKEKHFIKHLTDIKFDPKLSKVEKVATQASLLRSFKVKKAAEAFAKSNPQEALKHLKTMLVKPNGEAIGGKANDVRSNIFNRTLPGDEKTARKFYDNLVDGAGMSDLVVERITKDGEKLFVADKPGFGSIAFRPDTKSGPPGIGIDIPQFRGIVQKIKFIKE